MTKRKLLSGRYNFDTGELDPEEPDDTSGSSDLSGPLGRIFSELNIRGQERGGVQRAIIHLDASETQAAIDELISTSKFLPTIAEIRAEITRAKAARVMREDSARALRDDSTGRTMGPRPEQWKATLGNMLDDAARYDQMARAWYASKGKPYPGNPAAKLLEIAASGARGDPVHVGSVKPDMVR